MIKDNQQYFNKLHVLIDALVIIVSYVFAWWLKFLSGILDHEVGVLSFEFYMRALLLIVPVYILLYYAFNLYTSKRVQGRRLEFSNIVMANTVGLLLMFAALFTLTSYNPQYRNFSREMLFYFYVTNIVVEEIVPPFDPQISAKYSQKGIQFKAHSARRLFKSGRAVYRQNSAESAVGIQCARGIG